MFDSGKKIKFLESVVDALVKNVDDLTYSVKSLKTEVEKLKEGMKNSDIKKIEKGLEEIRELLNE